MSMDRSSGFPAKARLPGQVGEKPMAELPRPLDETPTTAAVLITALLPLGEAPSRGFASLADDRWLPGPGLRGAWRRIRGMLG